MLREASILMLKRGHVSSPPVSNMTAVATWFSRIFFFFSQTDSRLYCQEIYPCLWSQKFNYFEQIKSPLEQCESAKSTTKYHHRTVLSKIAKSDC
jgi:hypothetical protein